MERRSFLRKTGMIATGALFANHVIANIPFTHFPSHILFSDNKLAEKLENYFNKYFQGKMFDQKQKLLEGSMYFSKSFCIDIVDNKNSVFDIADLVIDKCKQIGFDASSLKDHVIPKNMKIGLGKIGLEVDQTITMLIISELINYDAIMSIEKPTFVKTDLVPESWNEIKKIDLVFENDKMILYKGGKNEITIKKVKQPIEVKLSIKSIDPKLVFTPEHNFRTSVSEEIGKELFEEKYRKLIFNI